MKIKIDSDEGRHGEEFCLLTTHNGYQWSGGGYMTLEEIKQLHEFLGDWISGKEAINHVKGK